MPESDLSFYKDRILRLEAELNQARSELVQSTQIVVSATVDDERHCEDYLQLLFEVAFEGLAIHSNFIIIDFNGAIAKIWGYDFQHENCKRTDLIGRNILEFITPEYRDLVKTRIETNYPKSYEVKGIRQDGSEFPVEVQGKIIQWQGKIVRVTAVRDLSEQQAALRERKIVEAALLDTERRYQALFNHKSDAVFINSFTKTGKPSQFIEVNDAACISLGYSRAELLTMSPSDILPKDFHCKRETMETLRSQKYATSEVLHLTKEGKIFPVELSLVEFKNSADKTLVIAFARDISDRKIAEAALVEGEKRYQALFEAKSEAVFIHTFSDQGIPGNFIEVNEAACKSLGYSKAELMQMSPRDITPRGYKPPLNIPQKLAQDQSAIFEAEHITKDGKIFPVEVRAVLLDATEKRIVIDFVRDISDRKALELKLENLASLDYLTQVANRRQFDQYLESEWQRAWRDQTYLSLIMCDVDFFKLYNDCYGHQTGDKCLQQLVGAIANCLKRPTDLIARYGGEEFGVILPSTDLDGAINIAETIRLGVKKLEIPHQKSTIGPFITISLGIATLIPTSADFSVLIKAADQALYNAKQSGKDRYYAIQNQII